MAHPELGSKILDAVLEQLGEAVKVETQARLEGRNMTMVLAPEKKAVKKPEKNADKPSAPGDEAQIASESGESHAENEDK